MEPRRKKVFRKHRASVLVISMIFMLIFSALAVSIVAMSKTNVQIASNQHNVNSALAAAQSGQDVMRFWLRHLLISSSTPTSKYLSAVITAMQSVVAVSGTHFSGNMNAQIKDTINNYSNSSTVVDGNVTMNFDREDSTKIPAGFDLYRELDCDPSTYSEVSI